LSLRDSAKGFVYRHRAPAKRAIVALRSLLPAPLARRFMLAMEKLAFTLTPAHQGDTLPPAFHAWSQRWVRPKFERLGATSPEDLYRVEIRRHAQALAGRELRIASLGAGACDLELRLMQWLQQDGIDARMDCVDLNPRLMQAGESRARELGLDERMRFIAADATGFRDPQPYDVLVVNQFFHHVAELEVFCAALSRLLAPDGVLLSSDVVGRNGHLPWPDVDAQVQAFWRELSPAQTVDAGDGKHKPRYEPVDHAAYSNEGVRAQDVVACLADAFDFEVFLTFGAAIMPFVERRFGFNFAADGADAELLDRFAATDDERVQRGDYPASNMFAVLRHRGGAVRQDFDPISPQQHIALTQAQLAKA
jgi:SAM-dependent methyltransferase